MYLQSVVSFDVEQCDVLRYPQTHDPPFQMFRLQNVMKRGAERCQTFLVFLPVAVPTHPTTFPPAFLATFFSPRCHHLLRRHQAAQMMRSYIGDVVPIQSDRFDTREVLDL